MPMGWTTECSSRGPAPENLLACRPNESANMHRNNGKPDKPTIYQDFIVLAYCEAQPFVHPLLHQTAIHMEGIQTVLNVQDPA